MKTPTQITLRGIRLWPIQWRYVANMTIHLSYHYFMIIAGVIAILIMRPRILTLELDAVVIREIIQLIPAEVRDSWPTLIVCMFIINQCFEIIDEILPYRDDDPATDNPLLALIAGAFTFCMIAVLLSYISPK